MNKLLIRHRRGFTLIELLIVISIIGLLTAILVPRFWIARDKSAFTACGQNLKSLATSLQQYCNDNNQQLPATLGLLKPSYMQSIPTCPESGSDTYSASYQMNVLPSSFTIFCQGNNHVGSLGITSNQPFYIDGSGLGP